MVRVRFETIRVKGDKNQIAKQARKAIDAALEAEAKDVKIDLEKPTKSWRNKPTFKVTQQKKSWKITTRQKYYVWTDYGTRAHIIVPKKAQMLVFPPNSRPKTRPGSLKGGPGARGTGRVWASRVRHPGTDARKFSEQAAQRSRKRFPPRFAQIMRRRMSG
jgi:hypothetical protein